MNRPNTQRDAKIIAAARLGQTHEQIAKEHGLTRPRVTQIVNAATPRSPEETQRRLIADRLRSRWDELEKIVRDPPPQHSAIGKLVLGIDGKPVINASAVIQAVKAQLSIEQQYRSLFGMDLATRPGPILDERQIIMMAELRAVQAYRAQQAPIPPLPALPPGYHNLDPAQKMRAEIERLRIQKAEHDQALVEVVDAEIVND